MSALQDLPVELIVDIVCALDLSSLVTCSQLSRHFRSIISDPIINPWRQPINRFLRNRGELYEDLFSYLGRSSIFPEHNWPLILSNADLEYLLLRCSIPPLKNEIFEESFRSRFLPSWAEIKSDELGWREHFLGTCYRVLHRNRYSCTAEENWTKFMVFYHNGSIKQLEATSRSFNPLVMLDQFKQQDNLTHLPTRAQVVLQLRDLRVIALGTLSRTTTTFRTNHHAQQFLQPVLDSTDNRSKPREYLNQTNFNIYPAPAYCHRNYPLPSSHDWRWNEPIGHGYKWVGSFIITVQIMNAHKAASGSPEDLSLFGRAGRARFASFTWMDLKSIAPWMSDVLMSQGVGVS